MRAHSRSHRHLDLFLFALLILLISDGGALSQQPEQPPVPLDPACPLSFVAASEAVGAVTTQLFSLSQAHITGSTTSAHVHALARHMALADRPHHEPVWVELTSNTNVQAIRRFWQLSNDRFAELNPELNLRRVRTGTELLVWQYDPENPGRSRLRPNRGRLIDGEMMPDGEGWIVRTERFAFGARQTIDALIHASRVTMAEHPGGQDVLIADLSRLRGGRMHPHRSHESGRDVDVTYHRLTTDEPTFTRTRANQLDAARSWTYMRTLIVDHDAVYIFMDRRLQRRLYEYAESIGEHPAFLAETFQYGPRRHRNNRAPIRYARGHHDHIHARFPCTDNDVRCGGT